MGPRSSEVFNLFHYSVSFTRGPVLSPVFGTESGNDSAVQSAEMTPLCRDKKHPPREKHRLRGGGGTAGGGGPGEQSSEEEEEEINSECCGEVGDHVISRNG